MAKNYKCRSERWSSFFPLGLWYFVCLGLGAIPALSATPAPNYTGEIQVILPPKSPITLSTGPMDCTGVVPCTQEGLAAAMGVVINSPCALTNLSIRLERKGQNIQGFELQTDRWIPQNKIASRGYISGVEMGSYRMILNLNDGCGHQLQDTLAFQMVDRIAPVMKCKHGLNLGWSSYADQSATYMRIAASDLDEGSADNCSLAWVRVRRSMPSGCADFFIEKGYDRNENGRIEANIDGIDLNGDGDVNDFGEAFEWVNGMLMTPLQDFIELFCCDIGAVMTFELWGEDRQGNRNYCWAAKKLEPECKITPSLTMYADDPRLKVIDNAEAAARAFGDQIIWNGITCADLKVDYQVVKKLTCGAGIIERRWGLRQTKSPSDSSALCQQTIAVRPRSKYAVLFPADVRAECVAPPVAPIIVDTSSCDLLAVTVQDQKIAGAGTSCYKIFRTYTLVNWCAYDEKMCGSINDPANIFTIERYWSGYGRFATYLLVQTEGDKGTTAFYLSRNQTPGEGNLHDSSVGDNNDESILPVFCQKTQQYLQAFRYTQVIDVVDETRPVIKSTAVPIYCMNDPAKCVTDIQLNFRAFDACPGTLKVDLRSVQIALQQTKDSTLYLPAVLFDPNWKASRVGGYKDSFAIVINNLPEGTHDLLVQVIDECGNRSLQARLPFEVKDCSIARPICLNSLVVNLAANPRGGATTVLATDFVASPIYDCNGQGAETQNGLPKITQYSINRMGTPKNPNQQSLLVDCSAVGTTILVEIHAWDEVGNTDSCLSILVLEDGNKVCNAGGSNDGKIAGVITTEFQYPVDGVELNLSGGLLGKTLSSTAGKYFFPKLQTKSDYTVIPFLDADLLNGISTLDLVLIQNHLFGVQVIDSPYKLIAADINNSKSITTMDVVLLRKVILNLTDRLENNTSWRFVDADYRFPNPANPWQEVFPEQKNIQNLVDSARANFIGIKIGDVNGNANIPPSVVSRQSNAKNCWPLQIADRQLETGIQTEIAIRAKDLQQIIGFQFALQLDPQKVRLLGIDYGGVQAENISWYPDEGVVLVSWNRPPAGVNPNDVLFTLQLRPLGSALLSQTISLARRYLNGEAYEENGAMLEVGLSFLPITVLEKKSALIDNFPNPFHDQTQIRFFLPEPGEVRLTLRDANGKTWLQTRLAGVKDWNQIVVKPDANWPSGILYYTLETPFFNETSKMVYVGSK
jgi:hypothetical protein